MREGAGQRHALTSCSLYFTDLCFILSENKYSAQTEKQRRGGGGGGWRPLSVCLFIRLSVRRNASCGVLFKPLPLPPSQSPQGSLYGFSLVITSSRGFAPPKMAELGLATWFSGSETVRGFSWRRGRCARSSSDGSLKSVAPPRGMASL